MLRIFLLSFVAALAFTGGTSAQLSDPTDEDLATGERLFNAHCAICHSIGGTGGRGPDLTRQPFRRVQTDAELIRAIDRGIPGTEMPRTFAINDDETLQVAAYVRSLGRVDFEPAPGDADRGKELYDANDCATCHIIAGEGRGIGPELTTIGMRRSLDHLKRSIARPGEDVIEEYLFVRAAPHDGDPIEGIRINEDSFTIQLRDINGQFHSLRKTDLKTVQKRFNQSLMFDYSQRLNATEIDDLVAYMADLREEHP